MMQAAATSNNERKRIRSGLRTRCRCLERVSAYHRRNRIRLPNPRLHSTIHVIVENQIAAGMAATRDALARLISEGPDESYLAALRKITAREWLKEFGAERLTFKNGPLHQKRAGQGELFQV